MLGGGWSSYLWIDFGSFHMDAMANSGDTNRNSWSCSVRDLPVFSLCCIVMNLLSCLNWFRIGPSWEWPRYVSHHGRVIKLPYLHCTVEITFDLLVAIIALSIFPINFDRVGLPGDKNNNALPWRTIVAIAMIMSTQDAFDFPCTLYECKFNMCVLLM